MNYKVSVIICTRNRAASLSATLESVLTVDQPGKCSLEVVVVDNGSSDHTHKVVTSSVRPGIPVRYVPEPREGVSHARNAAIRHSTGDVLLWVDDDVQVPRNWLSEMVRPMIDGRAEVVAGKVRLAPDILQEWMEPFHRTSLASTEAIESGTISSVISASMGFDREVLNRVPGFDTELGAGALGSSEDVLFSWQLREAGYRIQLVDSVCVLHYPDPARLSRQAFFELAEARGRSLAYIKYHWMHLSDAHWTHKNKKPRWQRLLRTPHFVLAKRYLDWKRIRIRSEPQKSAAPISSSEYWTAVNYAYSSQYLKERKRERNYELRGLRKISAHDE